MVDIAMCEVHVTGDIGGAGISRLFWQRQDATTPIGSDCNSAGAALHTMFAAWALLCAGPIGFQIDPLVQLYAHDTGLVAGQLIMSSPPAAITSGGGGDYAAGVGARVNWHTGSVHGRRYIRGATFVVPLTSSSYATNGSVGSGTATSISAAAQAYIAAMNAASLEAIVWHRPTKGVHTGGAVGLVTNGICSTVPAGLRSRRS